MDNHLDSESYWNRSTSKAFSFDDDDDETGPGSVCSGSVADSLYSSQWDSAGILNDDAVSEASYDNSVAAGGLNLSIKSVISEEALKMVLQEQTLDDEIIPKGVPADEELKILRRKMQSTFYSPSPEATAFKLLLGKNCPLEVFKSLQEKEKLLNAVLSNGGGDAIITVLLFMKKTLNRSKFHKILQGQPKALEHYISYLTQRRDPELYELLQLFGKPHDAVMQQLKAIYERSSTSSVVSDLHLRQQKLRQLLDRYTAGGAVIGIYQQLFVSSLKLIDLIAKERNALDNLVGVNSTPIEVLHACCRKHSNWKEQDMVKSISPFRVCAEQQISPAQFEWTALNERATAQAYGDLECVFERVPTWHPMKQKQFHISFSLDAAILRLYELKAPPVVLYHFVSKIGNAVDKLEMAKKVKCVKGTIDALVSLKDINQLTQLRDSLPDRSEEQFYCEKVLKGLQTKRWSTDSIKIKL